MRPIYQQYVEDVLSGKQISCNYIKQACQRFIDFQNRSDIEFRPEKVDRVVKFISLMKHFTGDSANKPFILEPWQQFIIAGIFGFYYKGTNNRVTKNAYIECSRKNGKTALAAAIGLYCMIGDGEPAAEVELVANVSKQAGICFSACKGFSESLDKGPKKYFKKYRDSLKFETNKSSLFVLSSDAGVADGYNSYCAIVDEYHAARNSEMYDVLKSSQGMRQNPLMIVITTAGFNLEGPCYQMRNVNIEILKGIKKDDSVFCCIYTLDNDDDYSDESVWVKCTPNIDVTVKRSYLRDQVMQAQNNPSLEVGIITKNFNKWLQTSETWIQDYYLLDSMEDLPLENMKQDYCYASIDLASVSDLTSINCMTFDPDTGIYKFKNWYYLPEDALNNSTSPNVYQYKQWYEEGFLKLTPGNVTDYDFILNDLLEINQKIPIFKCLYDTYNASQFVIASIEKGLPMVPYSQTLGNFNRPTREFERLLLSGKVVLDKNPITRWNFLNVMLKYDNHENVKPVKGSGKHQKIDGVITILQSLGGYLLDTSPDLDIVY